MPAVDIKSLIERAQQEFRAQRESQDGTSLDLFLQSVCPDSLSADHRRELVVSLIQLDIELTRKAGKSPDIDEYAARFPEFSRDFFAELISLPSIPQSLSGSLLPSRYQMVEQIGAGGLGAVWRVHDKQMNRTAAVKMLHANRRTDSRRNQRLRREAILTGNLQHPGVPPVYDSGQLSSGGEFFTMKLVEGQTLDAILAQGSHTQTSLIGVFEQIAQAVAYAHSQNVIHRDLKPQNIMVGEFGEVQVMDWGMAKNQIPSASPKKPPRKQDIETESIAMHETAAMSLDSSLRNSGNNTTQLGDVLGTPAYMSPEQAQGQNDLVSTQSDVFALGAILFEILSGQRLYDGKTAGEVLERAVAGSYGSVVERLGKETPKRLIETCQHCLEIDPQQRPDDASGIAEAIKRYQADVQELLRTTELERNAAMVQSREQRKRVKAVTWLTAIIAVVSLLGVGGIGWQWRLATEAANDARKESETRREINEFLILDLLRQADPAFEPDRNLKLRTVLDRAADKIDDRFERRPDVEAEIRIQIGRSYLGIGENQQAKKQLSIAVELLRNAVDEDDEDYWIAYHQLANSEHELGNYEVALEIYEEIEEHYQQQTGAEAKTAYLEVRSAIAATLLTVGEIRRAKGIQSEVVEELSLSDDSLTFDYHRAKLANIEYQLGQYDEAEQLLNTVIDSLESYNDMDSLEVNSQYIKTLHTLGLVFDIKANYVDAEAIHRKTLEYTTELLGPDHPVRLQYLNNLAINLLNQRKTTEAKELLDEAVPAMEMVLGADHDLTLSALNTLGGLHYTEKNWKATEEVLLKSRKGLIKKFAPPHQEIITNTNNLASLFAQTNRLEQAEEWFQQAIAECDELYGKGHLHSIASLGSLAFTHRRMGKFDLAEAEYSKAIEYCKENLPANHPDTLQYLSGLSFMYEKNDRFDEAEPLLLEAIAGQLERDGKETDILIGLKNRLAYTYRKLDRMDEAIPLYKEAYEYQRRLHGQNGKRTASVFFALIQTQILNDQFDDAKTLLEDALKKLSPERDRWLILKTESRLGNAALLNGDSKTAEAILLNAFRQQKSFSQIDAETQSRELRITAKYLIKVYETKEDPEKAEEWKSTYQSLRKK